MKYNDNSRPGETGAPNTTQKRKVYSAPAILSSERLESVAAVCGDASDVKSPGGVSGGGLACGSITGVTSS